MYLPNEEKDMGWWQSLLHREETDEEKRTRLGRIEQTFRLLIVVLTISHSAIISGYLIQISPTEAVKYSFIPLITALTFWSAGQLSPNASTRITFLSIAWAPLFFSVIYLATMIFTTTILLSGIVWEVVFFLISGGALFYTPIQVRNVMQLMKSIEAECWFTRTRHTVWIVYSGSFLVMTGLIILWFFPTDLADMILLIVSLALAHFMVGRYTVRELFEPVQDRTIRST